MFNFHSLLVLPPFTFLKSLVVLFYNTTWVLLDITNHRESKLSPNFLNTHTFVPRKRYHRHTNTQKQPTQKIPQRKTHYPPPINKHRYESRKIPFFPTSLLLTVVITATRNNVPISNELHQRSLFDPSVFFSFINANMCLIVRCNYEAISLSDARFYYFMDFLVLEMIEECYEIPR